MYEDLPNKDQPNPEPLFCAWRKRYMAIGRIVCIAGLVSGIALELPYVIALSILGVIVTSVKLYRMKM